MDENHRLLRLSYLIVSILTFASIVARADVTGSVTGVVHDRAQAVVVGAKVSIINTQTNFSQRVTSAADGSFHFLALPAGSYKVIATAPGFRPYTGTDITVQVNDQLHLDITLEVGAVIGACRRCCGRGPRRNREHAIGRRHRFKEDARSAAEWPQLPRSAGLAGGGGPERIVTIGGNGQQGTSGTGGQPVSGYIDNAGNVSVNGQRETANAFLVNGGDVSEGRNLGAGLVPNLDSVEEFRLITNSFDAEYGKFSGAVMNAITKSGTNGFHGDVFEFLRNDKLDAANFFTPVKSELRRNQFGGVAGDPSGRTSYSGSRITKEPDRCRAQKPASLTCRRRRSFRATLIPHS